MTTTSPVDGRAAVRLGAVFYFAVAGIALAGQTGAAVGWLHWPLLLAGAAVAALELGGITLAAWADFRQRLGERAVPARVLSAAVAVFAVAVNWAGHDSRLQAAFFAGMSALGYGVWLIQSGARRRDQLRAAGMLPEVPPTYGLVQWLRHPSLTRRARRLAMVDTTLGLYGSLHAAGEQVRAERRHAAIAVALHTKLSASVDKTTAAIATNTYDLEAIARRLADGADYDGLAAILAADLDPARLTSVATIDDAAPPAVSDIVSDASVPRQQSKRAARKVSTADRVSRLRDRNPAISTADIARRVGVNERTVTRYLKAFAEATPMPDTTPVNGTPVPDLIDAT